jgi:ADP-heptose:LPS heptosyltransferase
MRIGHADAREGASVLYTHAVRSPAVHTVDRMLDLLGPLGVPAIRDMRLATRESREPGPSPVVIAPTSRWPAKRWPIERFAELTRRVLGLGAGRIVVVGGPGEREQCGPLLRLAVSDPRVEDRVGSTSVAGLVSLIASARLVVANDSAAAHIAVGFDRPLVAMYGPTDITRVGPYRRRDDVLQHLRAGDGFDHKRAGGGAMMARITVEEAVSACRKHLTPSEPVC